MAKTAVVGTIAINCVANTAGLQQGMAAARRQMNLFTQQIPGTISALTGLGFGYMTLTGILREFIDTMDDVRKFQSARAKSHAMFGPDLTGDEAAKMDATAHRIAYSFQFTATEIEEGFKHLASSGLKPKAAMEAIHVTAKFAQAGLMGLSEATDQLSRSQHAMGLGDKDPQKNMVGLLRTAEAITMANRLALGETVDYASFLETKSANAARLAGMALEDMVAIGAVLHQQGIVGEEAGTYAHMMIRDIKSKSIKHSQEWADAEITAWDKVTEKFLGVRPVIEQLEKALANLTPKAQTQFLSSLGFTDRAMFAVQAMIGKSQEIRDAEKELQNTGFLDFLAENNVTPLERGIEKIDSAWRLLKIETWDNLLNGIGVAFSVLSDELGKQEFSWFKVQIQVVIFFAALMAGMVAFSAIAISVFGLIAALYWLNTTLGITNILLGPVGWIALAGAAIMAAGAVTLVTQAYQKLAPAIEKAQQDYKKAIQAQREAEKNKALGGGMSVDEADTKAMEDFFKAAQRESDKLRKSLRTPWEEAGDEIKKLQLLLRLGEKRHGIGMDTYTRAVKKVRDDLVADLEKLDKLDKQSQRQDNPANRFGTAGEFSAVHGQREANERMLEGDKRRENLLRRADKWLQETAKNTAKGADIDIKQAKF